MSIQLLTPKYHWTFAEINNSATGDAISNATAQLFNAVLSGKGRIGNAIVLSGSDDSYISLGREIGQFGRADFTVAFGVKIAATTQRIELLGNRLTAGHGNFFSIRMTPGGQITAEVDEDSSGTNYIGFEGKEGQLDDGTWHHIAVVRQQNRLSLYVDGTLSKTGTASGVANIANGNEFRIGNPNPGVSDDASAPKAEFEDLRIYDRALSEQEISALVPPLKQYEIELTTTEGVARIWSRDVADLSYVPSTFEKLRLGTDTGTTLYKDTNFSGVSQEVAADLPKLAQTRLAVSPKSLRIWSTVGKPFRGKWAILAPNGQYLSLAYPSLATSPSVTAFELFDFHINLEQQRIQLLPGSSFSPSHSAFAIVTNQGLRQTLGCVEEETNPHRFSLVNSQGNLWLTFQPLSNLILLKSHNGQYLRAKNDGLGSGTGAILADSSYPRADSVFELIKLQSNKVALKSFYRDLYIGHFGHAPNLVVADFSAFDTNNPDRWHSYELVELDHGRVAFRNQDGNYFCAEAGGGGEIVANRSALNIWEKFERIQTPVGQFSWTSQYEERAIFTRALKIAENESQIGELMQGEAAFYEQSAYWGKTWVLYNSCSDFRAIEGLNDAVSSIRLGPETGITLYSDPDLGATSQDREKDIEDIVENIPDLSQSQIGNDKLSSAKIWSNIPPKKANVSFSVSMSQDYKLVGEELQEFSSYRTILKFLPEVTEVEIWATDLTKFEVDGTDYEVDEDRSVKLSPNSMNRLMITSEAEGINTPGLKIRTNTMQDHERIVIFPDREVHRKIATLDNGALWNAKVLVTDSNDAQKKTEKWLVERNIATEQDVQAAQNTITNMMKTVSYVSAGQHGENQVVDREIMADPIVHPWRLSFSPPIRTSSMGSVVPGAVQVRETEMDQDEFQQLLEVQASAPLAQGWKNVWRQIKSAVKNAVSVVVGVVEKVVHVVVTQVTNTVRKVEQWVIDTAEKVGAFVEGVVEKIGVAAKQFVEYLRSIFNWDDILSTQDCLVKSINTELDNSVKLAATAKKAVSTYMSELKGTVKSKLDQIIRELEGGQSGLQKSGPNLPEELEWFLSKLIGGSGSKRSSEPIRSNASGETGDDRVESLRKFNTDFLNKFGEIQGKILARFNGLVNTISVFVSNPYNPKLALIEILRVMRDLTTDFLTFIEGIAQGLLDVISVAVQQFKGLINTKINIPFITGLFKLIGAGDLSLLNLASLLIAIPVTIISKIVFKGLPFEGSPQDRKFSLLGWGITALTVDAVNGLIAARLDIVPEEVDNLDEITAGGGLEIVSLLLSFISWLGSFPDSPGFPGGRPYDIADPKFNVSKATHASEYWERVQWSWRSAILGYEIVVMAGSFALAGTSVHQRLKRRNEASIVLGCAFAAVDLGLTIQSTTIDKPKGNASDIVDVFSDYVPLIPDLFSLLRLPAFTSMKGFAVVAILDVVCTTIAGTGFGGATLHENLKKYKTA